MAGGANCLSRGREQRRTAGRQYRISQTSRWKGANTDFLHRWKPTGGGEPGRHQRAHVRSRFILGQHRASHSYKFQRAQRALRRVHQEFGVPGSSAIQMTQGTLNRRDSDSPMAQARETCRSWTRAEIPSATAPRKIGVASITLWIPRIAGVCNSDLKNLFATRRQWQDFPGPPLRSTASGSAFSTLALDPATGNSFRRRQHIRFQQLHQAIGDERH